MATKNTKDTKAESAGTQKWTEQQRAAMLHVGGDLLVSAAAGSGKTAVLAQRCAHLVANCGPSEKCGIENLLVLTFTDAAANEMRARIAQALRQHAAAADSSEKRVWLRRQSALVQRASISTLHAFCSRVLRQHFHEAAIDPGFYLLDDEEGRLLREEVMDDLLASRHQSEDAAFADFFESYAQGRDTNCRELIFTVYHMLASSADPADYLAKARARYADAAATVDLYRTHLLIPQLRLLGLAAHRYVTRAIEADAPVLMPDTFHKISESIAWSITALEIDGLAAFDAIRQRLSEPWPRLATPKDFPGDFETFKDATWNDLKKKLKSFVDDQLVFSEQQLLANLPPLAAPLEALLSLVEEFTKNYTALKRSENRLDFADLERLTLDLLRDPKNRAAATLRDRYHHVLVDEFQDINPLQAALLQALRSPHRFDGQGNLFVVGDVKQSIYAFRLADPELFLFAEKEAREGKSKFIPLPHNFRSDPRLLTAMNSIFEKLLTPNVAKVAYNDGHALEPAPSATSTHIDHPPIEMHLVAMDLDEDDEQHDDNKTPAENLTATEYEARMVADRIKSLLAENRAITTKDGQTRPLEFRDIAILLRAVKNRAIVFARALSRAGIPVHADLSTGFFDAPEVRDTLALLHALDNPQQDIPLATVMLGPHGRFSHDDLARIRLAYDKRQIPFAQAATKFITDHAADELAARLKILLDKLAAWRDRIRTRPLHEALADIYADSHIFAYLSGLDAGDQRIANLQALHQRALRFASFRKQGLHRFLRFIEKLREQDGDSGEAPILSEASNVVRILSVHKSKGLEFPVVFASSLGSQLNVISRGPVFIHRDLHVGLQIADIARNIYYPSALSETINHELRRAARAEELRLLYVAFTRARNLLLLTGHLKKENKLDKLREEWSTWTGPLPDDTLLRAGTSLDWLLPALAGANAPVDWPDAPKKNPLIRVELHAPTAGAAAVEQQTDAIAEKILCAQPLAVPSDPTVQLLQHRLTAVYSHQSLTEQPALMTVSQLKELAAAEEEIPPLDIAPPPPTVIFDRTGMEAAKRRGTATHRILQLLNLKNDPTTEIARLRDSGLLTEEEITAADTQGIHWLLTESAAGQRLRAAAIDPAYEIHREIPFIWTGTLDSNASPENPADLPTIRGVIDLLLVNKSNNTAEILDYKTDSAKTYQQNLPAYRTQLTYYTRAVRDVLHLKTVTATLLFLTPQKEEPVK